MRAARSRFVNLFAAALLGLLAAARADATSVLPLDLNDMVGAAEHIVRARCLGNKVQPDADVFAVTVTTFVVLDRAKGTGGATFVVRQPGGEIDGIVSDFHVPKFRVGDEYVLFMPRSSKLGLAAPVGLEQGVFAVTAGAGGKEVGNGHDFAELLARDNPANLPPAITAHLQGPRAERMRMNLDDFMTLVRAKAQGR
jgi:hypothetical protein